VAVFAHMLVLPTSHRYVLFRLAAAQGDSKSRQGARIIHLW
jgi:hypothetical protein